MRLSLVSLIQAMHPRYYRTERLAFQLAKKTPDGVYVYPEFWNPNNFPWTDEDGVNHWDFDEWKYSDDEEIYVLSEYVMPDRAADYFMIQMPEFGWDKKIGGSFKSLNTVVDEIGLFFTDRLKVALKEKGIRHDLIDAVFSLGNEDDLVRLVARVEALQSFLKSEEGADLLAGYKRAANFLKQEEKKGDKFYGDVDVSALGLDEEKVLFAELETAAGKVKSEIAAERFVEAMGVMAALRGPVDVFLDKVRVNDDNPAVRKARLELLARLRATLHLAADFSKIEG